MRIETDPLKKEEYAEMIKKYCEDELDVEIGNLGCMSLYDFFFEKFSAEIYNQAIDDAKEWYQARLMDLALDSSLLYKEDKKI